MDDELSPAPLPETITRRCCLYKQCVTELYLSKEAVLDETSLTGASVRYTYRRVSNEDIFWGPDTEAAMREHLADPDYLLAANS